MIPAFVLAASISSKPLPPCAVRIRCEVEGGRARCSPELVFPNACEARALDVAAGWESLGSKVAERQEKRWERRDRATPPPAFERTLETPEDYRVRVTVWDAVDGRFLGGALAYLLPDGEPSRGAYSVAASHPAIVSRVVPVRDVRFEAARSSFGIPRPAPAVTAAAVTVQGRIEYQDFPPGVSGLQAPITRPAGGIDVVVQTVGVVPPVSVSAKTDAGGVFRAALAAPAGSGVGVTFSARSAAAVVQDNLGSTYTWTTAGSPTPVTSDAVDLGTVLVDEAHDAGALNILDVIGAGYEYAASREAPGLPRVTVVWKRGLNAGTYYDVHAMTIHLLNTGTGATDDTDEWDDQVIAHEYSHHIQSTTSCNLSAGGSWSICDPVAPELAWLEGAANYLCLVISASEPQVDHVGALYLDTVGSFAAGSRVVLAWDLEHDACSGPKGPGVPGVVSNLLWDLQDATDDPPDTYSRFESDIFRLMLDLRGESHCDLSGFLEAMCRRDPADLPTLGGLFASYGVTAPAGCELPARGPAVPASSRRRPQRPVPPR